MYDYEIDNAIELAQTGQNCADELSTHPTLTDTEKQDAAEAFDKLRQIRIIIESRKVIAETDWELVESHLDDMSRVIEAIRTELPEMEHAEHNPAAVSVIQNVSDMEYGINEARSSAGELVEE